MGQVHQCGYLATEIIFEIERVREHARNQNTEALSGHLSLIKKDLQNMALHCELGDISNELGHISTIENNIEPKNWGIIEREALEFEKKLTMKQAKNFNDGNDPLDVIPTRFWDALK